MEMSEYIASYGNGTRRIFEAANSETAMQMAMAYGKRHHCGALLLCKRYT